MQPPRPSPMILIVLMLLVITGCSRLEIAYGTADFFIKGYAVDYLNLDDEQLDRWVPQLKTALTTHRNEELPYVAGFVEALLQASEAGFDVANSACLMTALKDLYARQARLVVTTAVPLLARLTPAQVRHLEQRFARDDAEDRVDPTNRDLVLERRKRANRYTQTIADWTGPLSGTQRALVADITGRMPDATVAVLDYRRQQRQAFIALLRTGADEATIRRFLTAWLVDFRDLPPALTTAGQHLQDRLAELILRLGGSLDPTQQEHLRSRLRELRDDLMRLQQAPRLIPMGCTA